MRALDFIGDVKEETDPVKISMLGKSLQYKQWHVSETQTGRNSERD